MAGKKNQKSTPGGNAQAPAAVQPSVPVVEPPVVEPPVDEVETTPELPNVKVRVLHAALDYAEGGHRLVTYPAGHRVADMSDEAQEWLVKNDLDENGKPGRFTKLAELPDEEGAKLAADIAEAQKVVDEATENAKAAATAYATAETPEDQQAAEEANNNASTALSAAQRKLKNLNDDRE